MNALVWKRRNYTLYGTDNSYILALPEGAALTAEVITLACGEELQPGDTLTRLGGSHTSALYCGGTFSTDYPLTYRGMYSCKDGDLLCFTQSPVPGRQAELSGVEFFAGQDWYYAWAWIERGREFLFVTPPNSARVIETEIFQR